MGRAPGRAHEQIVIDALDPIANGSTPRAGRCWHRTGIRFIIVPEIDGAQSTDDDPLPVPAGLLEALSDQLDIGRAARPAHVPGVRDRAVDPGGGPADRGDGRRQPPRR